MLVRVVRPLIRGILVPILALLAHPRYRMAILIH